MFSPHLATRQPLAAPLVLSLIMALGAASNAGARPYPDQEIPEPAAADPVSVAHASAGMSTWGDALIVAAALAILAVTVAAVFLRRDKHRVDTNGDALHA
jgi:hypothetical protein